MTNTTDKPTDKPADIAALIAEAEAALQGVTAGPWLHEWEIDGPKTHTRIKAGAAVATTAPQCGRPHHNSSAAANARFIAYARQGVPDLIAALRQVMAERDSQTERLRLMIERAEAAGDKLDAARAMKGTAQ